MRLSTIPQSNTHDLLIVQAMENQKSLLYMLVVLEGFIPPPKDGFISSSRFQVSSVKIDEFRRQRKI